MAPANNDESGIDIVGEVVERSGGSTGRQLTVTVEVLPAEGSDSRPPEHLRTTSTERGRFETRLSLDSRPSGLVFTVSDDGTRVGRTVVEDPSDEVRVTVPIDTDVDTDGSGRSKLLPAAATVASGVLAGCMDALFGRDEQEESAGSGTQTQTPFEVAAPEETSTETPTQTEAPTDTRTPTETSEPTDTATETPLSGDGSSSSGSGSSSGSDSSAETASPTDTPDSPTSSPTDTPGSPTSTPTDTPDSPTSTPTDTPPPQEVPSPPDSVSAQGQADYIDVTWPGVDSATSYNLYWSTSEDLSPDSGTQIRDVSPTHTHVGVRAGREYHYVVTAVNGAGESPPSPVASATVAEPPTLDPPDDPDPRTQTTVDEIATALYDGDDPVQSGVDPDAVQRDRVSIIRGTVTTREGDALSNVTVSTPENTDLGTTRTRSDGLFDMAVNGGSAVVLRFERSGYLPVQRTFSLKPNARARAPTVALIQEDGASTTVEMDADEGQIHEASTVSDDDGERRATVYVPPGTSAVRSDDGTAPSSLELRATEYTVGENGPEAMPGELPRGVGYTYAPELTGQGVDSDGSSEGSSNTGTAFIDAESRGDIGFDQPVVEYEYNFLGFPVGTPVPVGSYDDERANWVPSDDGRVIEILGVEGGVAALDVDGSGQPADRQSLNELGVTDDELETLADSYSVGDQLWRTPVPHFTPWDCNWSIFPPENAVPPLPEIPDIDRVLEETPPGPPSPPKGETPQEKEETPCEN